MERRNLLKAGSLVAAGVASTTLVPQSAMAATSLPPACFINAHFDDETLGPGDTLAEHFAASPGQDIHVLWVTDSTNSGVRNMLNGDTLSSYWGKMHVPADEGYGSIVPISPATMGSLRKAEANNAVRQLWSGLPGKMTLHYGTLVDGFGGRGTFPSSSAIAAAKAQIYATLNAINPGGPVRIKCHSWLVDNSADHLAIGLACKQLAAQYPTRFHDIRYYSRPAYWADSRLSKVKHGFDLPTNANIRERVIDACRAYLAWAPPHAFAIGGHSVSDFTKLIAKPQSLYHL